MNTIQEKEKASALIVALLVIFLIAASIGIAMNLTTGTLRQTDSSRDFAALRSAAEGAVDFGYGVWAQTINNFYKPVSTSQLSANLITTPAFPGFAYATTADGPLKVVPVDGYGVPVAITTATPPPTRTNLTNYPGWVGSTSSYVASARLVGTFTGGRSVSYGVKRSINYTVVPLFQSTAFFEDNLELYRTAPMTIKGLVYTNSEAYVSSSSPVSSGSPSLTFTGNLSYVKGYIDGKWTEVDPITHVSTQRDAPPEAWTWSGYVPNNSYQPNFSNGGYDAQVSQVDRMEPLGADSAALLHPGTNPDGTPTADKNPNDDSMRELIEPPMNTAAYPDPTPIADRRLYNKAGIRIHMTVSKDSKGKITTTTTVTTQNGTTLTGPQTTALTNALSQQTIYDRREGQNIDVTTLDMSKANATLNAAAGFNNIIYIDQTDTTGAISTSDPQGIRVTNGKILPSDGLTIASQNPVYVQGDYNIGTKSDQSDRVPSAIFGDAVTILSNAWKDTNSGSSLSARNASDTTVNTAIVAGFLPSGWTNPITGEQYGYSGGLNNFPRFLEDWSNNTFNYTGSMIELFTSKVAIGEWDTDPIYLPPNRVWGFDDNFVDNPPPGSLDAVSVRRGALARF